MNFCEVFNNTFFIAHLRWVILSKQHESQFTSQPIPKYRFARDQIPQCTKVSKYFWYCKSILPTFITYRTSIIHISLIMRKSSLFFINLKFNCKAVLFMKSSIRFSLHRKFVRSGAQDFVQIILFATFDIWHTKLRILNLLGFIQ